MFSKTFRKFVSTTAVFFVVRLVATSIVALVYLIMAAGIQYAFVSIFGESTFNYILGGIASLGVSAVVCNAIGNLMFMFVKGWHVAALAYTAKIRKSGAPALAVGIRAFNRNIVSFGAVYGIRLLLKNVMADFKTKLWEISEDIPYSNFLRSIANHPIVEYLSRDLLHYGFDAAIFYIVKYPPDGLDDVPSTALEAIKRYLCALPGILISSIQTYIMFRFVPNVLKALVLIWIFFTHGLLAGILISVLTIPVFYILDNVFFDPLTMMVFLSAFAKKCRQPLDEGDPVVAAVDAIMSGVDPSGSADAGADADGENAAPIAVAGEAVVTSTSSEAIPTGASGFTDVGEVGQVDSSAIDELFNLVPEGPDDEDIIGDLFPDPTDNAADLSGGMTMGDLESLFPDTAPKRRIHSDLAGGFPTDVSVSDTSSPFDSGESPMGDLSNIRKILEMSADGLDEDPLRSFLESE